MGKNQNYTEILYDKEAREDIYNGVVKLARAVKSTLGPNGKHVIIKKFGKLTNATKDGVTVADNIRLENPREDIGRQLITEVAYNTDLLAGDGTTTSTVLTEGIVTEGMKIFSGNVIDIKRGMETALQLVLDKITNVSTPIKGRLDKMVEVATVSANGDLVTGRLVAEAVDKVGENGKVDIVPTNLPKTEVTYVDGMTYYHGAFFSPYLAKDITNSSTILERPLILVFDTKINDFQELAPLLGKLLQTNKDVVMMMTDVSSNVLNSVLKNIAQKETKFTILKNPRETGMVDDLATLIGAKIIDETTKLDLVDETWCGTCEEIKVKDDLITFTDGNGDKKVLENYVNNLNELIEDDATDKERKELYKLRVAKLTGGVAKIKVGGKTEVEMLELFARIIDSYHSTKSAIEDGVVVGGGFTLLRIQEEINKDKKIRKELNDGEKLGFEIVIKSLSTPARQILDNGGLQTDVIINNVLSNKSVEYGYNSMTDEYGNLIDMGILDSARNTKISLKNAVSVASLLITTDCIIIDSIN